MKKTLAALVVAGLAIAGCKNDKNGTMNANPAVTEVAPAPIAAPAPQAYVPPPQPVAVQPVTYDAAPAAGAPAAAPAVAGAGNYTVKKGDTLYSIAKARYGNGNQYARIVSANPGLTPERLKVGQTIAIP
jgi:nucleoid-associated protein YgaU